MEKDGDLQVRLVEKATRALAHWGLADQIPELLKYRENAVFRVRLQNGEPAALRLHRPGYHDFSVISSELEFCRYLAACGLGVPVAVPTRDDALLSAISDGAEEQFASIVTWLEGVPLGQTGVSLRYTGSAAVRVFRRMGETFADLHNHADRFEPPVHFLRVRWDNDGLLGEAPLWGRFWDCAGLDEGQAGALTDLRAILSQRLNDERFRKADYGLIHGDGVRENVMITAEGIGLIDFDDFGHGYRLFELATILLKNRGERNYAEMERALIDGYTSRRTLDDDASELIKLFLVLRSATYIGWASSRDEMRFKVPRYADDTLALAYELL